MKIKELVRIEIPLGLHARPVSQIVASLKELDVSIFANVDERKANLKSMLESMLLAAPHGSLLDIEADGPDAEKALMNIREILSNKGS
jgi:phosphocarrier protein HPr